jgi:hypothetical protein
MNLVDFSGERPAVSFRRFELGRILDIYSTRVAAGEWRDYAIDQIEGRAVFSIFRHSMDRPLFTITKRSEQDWEIANGPRSLAHTDSLDKALEVFTRRELRLV